MVALWCTGSTHIVFNPPEDSVIVDKKKFFLLPSAVNYKLHKLVRVEIETDSDELSASMNDFKFYCVTLVFRDEQVGIGRDCSWVYDKIELVNRINNYLHAREEIQV